MSDEILVERIDRTTRITLNRPDSGNAMTDAMAAALGHATTDTGESCFIVLCGAGNDFSPVARAWATGRPNR